MTAMIHASLVMLAVLALATTALADTLATTEEEREAEDEEQAVESNDDGEVKAGDFGKKLPCLLSGGTHTTCPEPIDENLNCPEGYSTNGEENCFPSHDECPKNTHSVPDDETGACHHDNGPNN